MMMMTRFLKGRGLTNVRLTSRMFSADIDVSILLCTRFSFTYFFYETVRSRQTTTGLEIRYQIVQLVETQTRKQRSGIWQDIHRSYA